MRKFALLPLLLLLSACGFGQSDCKPDCEQDDLPVIPALY